MRKLKSWSFFIILAALFACTEKPNSEAEKDTVNIELAVAESVEALNNALINPENALFDDIVMEELSYGHSSGKVQDKDELISDLINGSFDFIAIDVSEQTIDIIGKTAIVRHILSAKADNAGTAVEIRIGIFLVYQIHNNQWKLLARQAYKL